MPHAHRPSQHAPLLVVSADAALVGALTTAFPEPDGVLCVESSRDAMALVQRALLAGAVLDMALLGREALGMASAFLSSQPLGRVVLVEGESGLVTLVGLARREGRIECLTRPVDVPTLLDCLALSPAVATSR